MTLLKVCPLKVCLSASLCLAAWLAPSAAAQLFANHSNNMVTSGDNFFYHADFNNDGIEDLAYVNQPNGGTLPGTFVVLEYGK